jgi:Fe-S-cluster containining protein
MTQPLTQPAAGRSCGGCTMCCKVLGITELQKPVGTWCPHCDIGKGCKIYSNRPEECRTFFCLWLVDARFSEAWKPDRSKMVLTTGQEGNSVEIRCDPGSPTAWRAKEYHDEIIRMAEAAEPHDGSLYVIIGNKNSLITPTDEFPLGEVPPDHVIVKEMSGHRVTGVKVVTRAEWQKLK